MPIRRIQRGRNHSYTINGEKAFGVTTALSGGWPKPNLTAWYARCVAEAAAAMDLDEYTSLRTTDPDKLIAELKKAPNAIRDGAAERGTKVHKLAEHLVRDEAVEVPDELFGMVDSCRRFLDEWQVRPLLMEKVVGSYAWGYAGTFDLIGELPDQRRILFDYKTGKSGIWPETALQLAAYRHADAYLAEDGVEIPMREVGLTGCAAVWIRPDGYDVIPLNTDERVFKAFLHTLQVAKSQLIAKDWVLPAIQPSTKETT